MDNHNMTNLVFTDEANLTFTFLVFVFLKKNQKTWFLSFQVFNLKNYSAY